MGSIASWGSSSTSTISAASFMSRGSSSAESRSATAPRSSTALPTILESVTARRNSAAQNKPVWQDDISRPNAYSPSLEFPSWARDQNLMSGALAANNPFRISTAYAGDANVITNRLSTYNIAPGGGSASVEYCVVVLVLDPRGSFSVAYYVTSPGWTNGVGGVVYYVACSPYLPAPYNVTGFILGAAHAPNPTPAGGAYPFNLQTPPPYSSAYPGAPLGGYATNIQTNSATAGQYWQGQPGSAAGTNFATPGYSSAYLGASGHATTIWANGATAGRWVRSLKSAAGTNCEAAPSAQALPTENVLVPQAPNQQNHTTQEMQGNTRSVNPTMPEPVGQQFVPPQDGSKPSNIINRLLCVVIVMLSIIIFRLM